MTGSAATQETPLRYEEITADGYAEAFATGCTAVPTRRGVLLKGTCPRCGDAMDFPLVKDFFRTALPLGGISPPAAGEEHPLLCTCQEVHSERPAGEDGCGAYWIIRLTRSPS